ncbi:MAG: hypothetical protein K6F64_01035 [Clostridia bacterium]|nr:hypothetical protein [Clostridia bacterium]
MKLDLINGLKEGKKLSPRDIQMVIVIAGLVILIAVYVLVFNNYNAKNTELTAKLEERNAFLTELKGYYDNLDTYKAGVNNAKESIAANLARLPAGINEEDFLIYALDSLDAVGASLMDISFNGNSEVSELTVVSKDKSGPGMGCVSAVTITSNMTYDQMKQYLDYIYEETEDITFINNVSYTYDAENATLQTTFNLAKYYIDSEVYEYEPVPLPGVNTGTDNPFGTRE